MALLIIAAISLPVLAFGAWISYLVGPPILTTVVPAVVDSVTKSLDLY